MSRLILSDWHDWLNSNDSKNARKRSTKSKFSKNGQRNRRFPKKRSTVYWVDWLIWLKHLSYSCELIKSVHEYLVTWFHWLIYSSFSDYLIDWYIQVLAINGNWINTISHFVMIELIVLSWILFKSDPTHQPKLNFATNAIFRITLSSFCKKLYNKTWVNIHMSHKDLKRPWPGSLIQTAPGPPLLAWDMIFMTL